MLTKLDPNKPTVSYDFDAVLHIFVAEDRKERGYYYPLAYHEPEMMTPFRKMHEQLRRDAVSNNVVITTARSPACIPTVKRFVQMHNLPVCKIYCTSLQPKRPVLVAIGAVKHYDDRDLTKELAGSGVEFVRVDPSPYLRLVRGVYTA